MSASPNRTLKPMRCLAALAAPVLLASGLSAMLARAQSFDCQKAYFSDEKTICRDARLGQLDQELASVYGRWVGRLPKEERDRIQSNETLFVQARRRCGQNRGCIELSYRNRIEEVQEAIAESRSGKRKRGDTASDLPRRSSGSTAAEPPAGDRLANEQAAGSATRPAARSEREIEPRANSGPANAAHSDSGSPAPAPPVANPPTKPEAAEALRSAEREQPIEAKPSKRRHRTRTQAASSEPPATRAPLSGSKPDHAKREHRPDEAHAAAPPQPSAGSGSSGWVNPPPEH